MRYSFLYFLCLPCLADPLVNVMAHVGTSYMIDSVAYSVQKDYMTKNQAEVLSAVETLLTGLAYKSTEGFPGNTKESMLENTLGIGVSIGVRYEF